MVGVHESHRASTCEIRPSLPVGLIETGPHLRLNVRDSDTDERTAARFTPTVNEIPSLPAGVSESGIRSEYLPVTTRDELEDEDWLARMRGDGLNHAHFMVLKGMWVKQYAFGLESERADGRQFIRSGEEYSDAVQGHFNSYGIATESRSIAKSAKGLTNRCELVTARVRSFSFALPPAISDFSTSAACTWRGSQQPS